MYDLLKPLLFFILFPFFWGIVHAILSRSGGWNSLSKLYPKDKRDFDETERAFQFQTMRIGWMNYSSCMNIIIRKRGIELKPFFLFSLFHKPIYISWDDFRKLEKSYMNRSMTVSIANYRIEFYGAAVEYLRTKLND